MNLCDPDDPRAQNVTVFGKTGEGKSYFLKALVVSLLEEGVHVFVFDLDGEWRELCAYVGGVYIDHTTEEGRYLNHLQSCLPSRRLMRNVHSIIAPGTRWPRKAACAPSRCSGRI
ncbi:helicase HerA domain-containing protein [Paenibacillus rhizoplanae]|uniref:helicase HerA domain-containing protein n=1 Tax=Paenibacillus rhizoplanae TaxID=1917181 RepID=UPI0036197136